jgi:SAM-dependent methyltransferase
MADSIVDAVRQSYASAAASELSGHHAGVEAVAKAFGYTSADLAAVPAEAHMGLSCGNPTAFANLRPGEVVVDLGCGAGIDVLLAALKVGPSGRAIGIDMTPEMIERARSAARKPVGGTMLENVEFHLSTIDHLPLADSSVDCLVSNCVINLAADKCAVFREMYRVLKPGGRVAVSDIALKQALPEELARDLAAYIGCIAGALSFEEYECDLRQAGFAEVQVIDARKDLNAYALVEGQSACCSPPANAVLPVVTQCCTPPAEPTVHGGLAQLVQKYDLNTYAASVCVYALKAVM